jgi:hypothetical protein
MIISAEDMIERLAVSDIAFYFQGKYPGARTNDLAHVLGELHIPFGQLLSKPLGDIDITCGKRF